MREGGARGREEPPPPFYSSKKIGGRRGGGGGGTLMVDSGTCTNFVSASVGVSYQA